MCTVPGAITLGFLERCIDCYSSGEHLNLTQAPMLTDWSILCLLQNMFVPRMFFQ